MSDPEPLSDEWVGDIMERLSFCILEGPAELYHEEAEPIVREVAAAALEWVVDEFSWPCSSPDYCTTGRDCGCMSTPAEIRAKAREIREGV